MSATLSRLAGSVAVLALAAGLSACSPASPKAGVTVDPSATPTVHTVSLPVGFPKEADVPLFDGPILHVSHPGNVWAAWIASTDLVGDLAVATTQLVGAGFDETDAGEGYADFDGEAYKIRIVALVDDTWGSSLAYTLVEEG